MAVRYNFVFLSAVLAASCSCFAAELHSDVEFAKPNGVSLTLDASVPEGSGPFPAVIVVHGGGFTKGDKQTFVKPLFAPLTNARFAWFSINYRLAPQVTLPTPAEDVISAIRWVRENAAKYKVDAKRIALMGESAGAYLVDYAAVTAPKDAQVQAVVSFYGPHDLLFQIEKQDHGKLTDRLAAITGVPALNAEGEKRLREMSPYYLLHHHLPPFLLIHGTADEQVPYEQSIRFRRALQDHDSRCELFTVEGAKHGVGPWEQTPSFQAYKEKMIEWLRTTLR